MLLLVNMAFWALLGGFIQGLIKHLGRVVQGWCTPFEPRLNPV